MSSIAIQIENLWKQYRLGRPKSTSFRESISQYFTRQEEDFFWALREVQFSVKHGEAVGIIGKNGAGKSTLLKVLSKITYPTKGKIEIDGRISSLLEVGTGFHPELTGRQNVFLNGSILGMTRNEIRSKFDEIVAFSGVEKFIDMPVKHYSSGMKVRLAFSVAAHLEPEILIIDEVLAVGDAEFQKKCLGKMEDVTSEGRTVLFVSHNLPAVSTLCSKGVLLQKGSIKSIGEVSKILDEYLDTEHKITKGFEHNFKIDDSLKFAFEKLEMRPQKFPNKVAVGDPVHFVIHYKLLDIHHIYRSCHISLEIRDRNDQKVLHITSKPGSFDLSDSAIKKGNSIVVAFATLALKPGVYNVSINCVQSNEFLDRHHNFFTFEVVESTEATYASDQHSGIWIPPVSWYWGN